MTTHVCNVCKKGSNTLKQCGQCYSVVYCSEECQVQDWSQGGHRVVCQKRPDESSWNTKITTFLQNLEKMFETLEFPRNVQNMSDLENKLKQRNKEMDKILGSTKNLVYSMLKAKGASQAQLDLIERQTSLFQEELDPIATASIGGKHMNINAMENLQGRLDVAQNTINLIVGKRPESKEEKEAKENAIFTETTVKIVSRAGQMLAQNLLARESNSPSLPLVKTKFDMSIPHPIGGNLANFFKRIPPYAASRATEFFGDVFRDFVYCIDPSAKTRTYSAYRRQNDLGNVKKEHEEAMEHIRSHGPWGGEMLLLAADYIEDASKMLEDYALERDPDKTKEWEAKRQTASILFSIALATGFGVYSGYYWTGPGEFRKELIEARTKAIERSMESKEAYKRENEQVEIYWNQTHAEFDKAREESLGLARNVTAKQNMFSAVRQRDAAFQAILEAGIQLKTGCSIAPPSGIETGKTTMMANTKQMDTTDLSSRMKDALQYFAQTDQVRNSDNMAPGFNKLSNADLPEQPAEIQECDPSQIMPAFKSVGSSLFATAESMLKQMPRKPLIPESVHLTEMERGLKLVEEQRAMYTEFFNTLPSNSAYSQNNPEAVSQLLQTLNNVNPRLSDALIDSIQQSFQGELEEHEKKADLFRMQMELAAWEVQQSKQRQKNYTTCINADEEMIKELAEEITGISVPTNPVAFASGTIVWTLSKILTFGFSTSQQQFSSGFLQSLGAAYDAMLAASAHIKWSNLLKPLAEFMTKAITFIWWLNVGLFEIAIYAAAFFALTAGTIVLLKKTRAGKWLYERLFTPLPKKEIRKVRPGRFVNDEGSAVHASTMSWLFGIEQNPVSFGMIGIFNALVWSAGALSVVSLSLGIFAASCFTLANITFNPSFWEFVATLPSLFTAIVFVTPAFRLAFGKRDLDGWYCLRRLLLIASGAASLTGLTRTFKPTIPIIGYKLGEWTPTWQQISFLLWVSGKLILKVKQKIID